MDIQAKQLLNEAMKLPSDTREILAAQLMGSVEPTSREADSIKEAWLEVIRQRVDAVDTKESVGLPIEQVWPKIAGEAWSSAESESSSSGNNPGNG